MKLSSLFNFMFKLLRRSKEIKKPLLPQLVEKRTKRGFRKTIDLFLAWHPFRLTKNEPKSINYFTNSANYSQKQWTQITSANPPENSSIIKDNVKVKVENFENNVNENKYRKKSSTVDFSFDPKFGFGEILPSLKSKNDEKPKEKDVGFLGEGEIRRSDKYGLVFRCDYCLKGFPTKGKLKNHMLTHTNILLFCFKCPSTFNSRAKLDAHCMKMHNGHKSRASV